jgi:two-component system sensor histidine kinase/response regulator
MNKSGDMKTLEDKPMTENYKILVIDDEVGICEGIQRALTSRYPRVDAAYEGEKGLQMVREERYDLILIDVMMPGINGIDLIKAIHTIDPEIICIIITGYATVELAVQAIKQGAYDFLSKPFSVDELRLAVNQGLERRKLSQEAKRTQAAEATAHRLAEEKSRLEELDQAKKQFIRLVTHELQAPVSAVENYLKLILKGYISQEKQADILRKCIARTQEERTLIADLLELGHLEVIKPSDAEPVQLDDILRAVLENFQEQIEQKKIDLQLNISEPMPAINAIPKQIKSLWTNLISNAVKYTPEQGKVSISLTRESDQIMGEVSDTGIGIPQGDQEKLFSEFFRAKNAKELEVPGTGLGLAIVKRILDGLKGRITVTSKPGQGSTFVFTIPIADLSSSVHHSTES